MTYFVKYVYQISMCSSKTSISKNVRPISADTVIAIFVTFIGCNGKEGFTFNNGNIHYNDVIMGTVASQITSLTIFYSTVYSGAYENKHLCSASLAFVQGIHSGPVNSPHKWPVTRKMFPFDDVIMICADYVSTKWFNGLKVVLKSFLLRLVCSVIYLLRYGQNLGITC